MVNETLKQDVLALLNGDFRKRSGTEFLELLNQIMLEHIKDPLNVENELVMLHARSKATL